MFWENNQYFYVGQAQNLNTRKSQHFSYLKNGKHKNKKMQNVFNKYGEPQFHIIEECDIDELNDREQFYLDLLFDDPNCLNIAKCAESPMRGVVFTKERCKQMSELRKGKKLSEKTKKKISDAIKGENHYRFGKKCSLKTKKKMSESQKKKVLQFSKSGEFIKEWPSASDASLCLKIDRRNISNCCIGFGRVKSAGGFVWKFKKEI
jgi:group I intron endonuclease